MTITSGTTDYTPQKTVRDTAQYGPVSTYRGVPGYLTAAEEAKAYITPIFDKAEKQLKDYLGQNGIQRSSYAAGQYGQLVKDMGTQESLLAQDLYRNYRDFAEGNRQFNVSSNLQKQQLEMLQEQFGVTMGQQIFESLMAAELYRAQLYEIPSWYQEPEQPSWYSSFFNDKYTPIQFSSTGPTGDVPSHWPMQDVPAWESSQLKLDRAESDRANQYLKIAQAQDARAQEQHAADMELLDTEGNEEQSFLMALWQLAWEPLLGADGNPAMDQNGQTVYKYGWPEIQGFIRASGRDPYNLPPNFLQLLRDDVREELKTSAWRRMQPQMTHSPESYYTLDSLSSNEAPSYTSRPHHRNYNPNS